MPELQQPWHHRVIKAVLQSTTGCVPGCRLSLQPTTVRFERMLMKMTKIAMLVLTIAVALFILIPSLSWAEDGAALFKAKCAVCHGPDGAGKPALKAPSLVSDEVKKKSDDDIIKVVQTNPKHTALAKALSADQLKAIVGAIRDLQKK
jgi:mono/diheme cytochrome c family protein